MNTVMISLDYHGEDETSNRADVVMTRMEMRALLVWMGKKNIRDFPSENAAVAFSKVWGLISRSEQAITIAERENRG